MPLDVIALQTFKIVLNEGEPPVTILRGNNFTVNDKLGEELFDAGMVSLPEDLNAGDSTSVYDIAKEAEFEALLQSIPDPDSMTLAELKQFAAESDIDISGATKKAEIAEIIKTALIQGE